MAVVNEVLDLPGGGSPTATVTIELVGEGGYPVEGFTSTATVVGPLQPTVTEGAWTATLVGNDDITPTGTVYKRTVKGRGYGAADYFEVPASGGPYDFADLLTDPPGAIEQTALAAERATRAAADAALDGRLDTAEATLAGLGTASTLDAGTGAGEVRTNTQNDGTYAPLAGNTFCALGDSMSDPLAGGGYGNTWPEMAAALSMQQLNFILESGVSGNTSAQVLARVTDATGSGAKVVSLLVGRNDITGSVSLATFQANITAIVAALRTARQLPVLCTIPPRSTTTNLAETLSFNRWLSYYARANSLPLVDFFRVLVDPTTGAYASGMAADTVHPSPAGHVAMATEFNRVVLPYLQPFTPIRPLTNTGDTSNLLSNPLLCDGSPTPTSWTAQGTGGMTGVTEGVVSDADFLGGEAYEMDFNLPSNAAGFRQLIQNAAASWSAGDVLLFVCKTKVLTSTGITPGSNVGLRMMAGFSGGSPTTVNFLPGETAVHGAALHWFTYTVPASTTTVQLSCLVSTIPTTARLQVRFGEFAIYNLTTLGLA